MNRLSLYLREKRVSKKMNQSDFAKALGLSFQTYVKLEQGKRPFSLRALTKIAKAINETADRLLKLSLESNQSEMIASNPKKKTILKKKSNK